MSDKLKPLSKESIMDVKESAIYTLAEVSETTVSYNAALSGNEDLMRELENVTWNQSGDVKIIQSHSNVYVVIAKNNWEEVDFPKLRKVVYDAVFNAGIKTNLKPVVVSQAKTKVEYFAEQYPSAKIFFLSELKPQLVIEDSVKDAEVVPEVPALQLPVFYSCGAITANKEVLNSIGAAIVTSDGKVQAFDVPGNTLRSMWVIGAKLFAAVCAINQAKLMNLKAIELRVDDQSVIKFADGEFDANKPGTKWFSETVANYRKEGMEITFTLVGSDKNPAYAPAKAQADSTRF